MGDTLSHMRLAAGEGYDTSVHRGPCRGSLHTLAVPRGLCRVSQGVSQVCVPQLAGLSTVAGVDVDADADVVRLHSRAARRCGVCVAVVCGCFILMVCGFIVLMVSGCCNSLVCGFLFLCHYVFVSRRLCVTVSLCHYVAATLRHCTLSCIAVCFLQILYITYL